MTKPLISRPEDIVLHPSGWLDLPGDRAISRLPLWDSAWQCFARIGHGVPWLAERGWRLPSTHELDELHRASLYISPFTLPTVQMLQSARIAVSSTEAINRYRNEHMRTQEWCRAHDEEVFRRLAATGWDPAHPAAVSNAGKHWCEGGTIYGWWRQDGSMIQRASRAHATDGGHTDYATTTHVVRVDGAVTRSGPPTIMRGDSGPAVGKWQAILNGDERPVMWGTAQGISRVWPTEWRWPLTVDDEFGPRTEAATECWQNRRGLTSDGICGPKTWAASEVPDPPDTLPAPPPSLASPTDSWRVIPAQPLVVERIKFIPARAENYRIGRQCGKPNLIMLHTAECGEVLTSAEQLAAWCRRDVIKVSWTYAVDANSIVQCVLEEDSAWACPAFNARAIHIEMAGYARQGKVGWEDDYSRAVIRNTAELVRWILSRRPAIPAVRLGWGNLLALSPGICGHDDGTLALVAAERRGVKIAPWWNAILGQDGKPRGWRRSTHLDPGACFPWDEFMEMVRQPTT